MPRLTIHLNARIMPIDRGSQFEDPLFEVLEERFPGTEWTGAGTQTSETGEPVSCDIVADVPRRHTKKILSVVAEFLTAHGAPKGSWAGFDPKRNTVTFGELEGTQIRVDVAGAKSAGAPSEFFDELLVSTEAAVTPASSWMSVWESNEWLTITYYGRSGAELLRVAEEVIPALGLARFTQARQLTT